jgi:putative ATP-dependent endonuclease of OLD family
MECIAAPADDQMSYTYISKVEITNFRNFYQFTLDMQPTSVVVGENRVGKSNLLHALRIVLDPSLADSDRQLREEDFSDELDRAFAGNIIEIKLSFRGFDENSGAKSVLADSITESNPLTATLTYQYRPRKGIRTPTDAGETDYEFIVFGGNDETTKVAAEVRKWLAITVLPALRDAETSLQTWRKSPLRPLLQRVQKLIPSETLEEAQDELDNAAATLIADPSIADLQRAINNQIQLLAGPLQQVETLFDFASGEPEQLLKSLRLYIEDTSVRPISDASLGSNNILFLALLLQELELRQTTKEIANSILAIEEPEAHLHPQLQRQIFRNFLRRQHSVIVTTHSPSIASVCPLPSLVLLRRVGGNTKSFTVAGLTLTEHEIHDLERYFDVTRAEILFSKGVILVEGVAEQFLIPAFAAQYLADAHKGSSLDDYGIAVCSVNGIDFTPYHKLLTTPGLAIPHVIVTDGDAQQHNGKKHYAGLGRGVRLVDNPRACDAISEQIIAEQLDAATAALESHNVFVGNTTLELDLLATFRDRMQETYVELNASAIARKRFNDSLTEASNNNSEAKQEVIRRITAIGKGRFAQRLTEKLGADPPPTYIRHAIERIVQLVEESHARPQPRIRPAK